MFAQNIHPINYRVIVYSCQAVEVELMENYRRRWPEILQSRKCDEEEGMGKGFHFVQGSKSTSLDRPWSSQHRRHFPRPFLSKRNFPSCAPAIFECNFRHCWLLSCSFLFNDLEPAIIKVCAARFHRISCYTHISIRKIQWRCNNIPLQDYMPPNQRASMNESNRVHLAVIGVDMNGSCFILFEVGFSDI